MKTTTFLSMMRILIVIALIVVVSGRYNDQQGECVDSIFMDALESKNAVDCLNECLSYEKDNNKPCFYATLKPYGNHKLCFLFHTCEMLDDNSCENCITNSREPLCDKSGLCIGQVLLTTIGQNVKECWRECIATDKCNWFSSNGHVCQLFHSCTKFFEKENSFKSGKKECNYD